MARDSSAAEIGAHRLEIAGRHATLAQGTHALLQVVERLTLVDGGVPVIVWMLVSAVRHLVADRLGIGP